MPSSCVPFFLRPLGTISRKCRTPPRGEHAREWALSSVGNVKWTAESKEQFLLSTIWITRLFNRDQGILADPLRQRTFATDSTRGCTRTGYRLALLFHCEKRATEARTSDVGSNIGVEALAEGELRSPRVEVIMPFDLEYWQSAGIDEGGCLEQLDPAGKEE